MNSPDARVIDRREFLRRLGRRGAAAGLALLGVGAVAGRNAGDRSAHTCTGPNGICTACPILRDCVLPQARSARAAGAEGGLDGAAP